MGTAKVIMKDSIITVLPLILFSLSVTAEVMGNTPETAVSLSWKSNPETAITHAEASDGDLYKSLSHHGPAIENKWVAYRMYFNETLGIDVLSKFHARLELDKSKWYGNRELFSEGYGNDNYKINDTVGLGGIRLWDGKSLVMAETGKKRYAQVIQTDAYSKLRMTTLAIPYRNTSIDLEIEVTVFNEHRHASVEVFVLSPEPVSLVTGIVKHDELIFEKRTNYLLTWGDYDSPAAQSDFDVGAALIYDPDSFTRAIGDSSQFLIISKPTRHLKYFITSANGKEESSLNTLDGFRRYLDQLQGIISTL